VAGSGPDEEALRRELRPFTDAGKARLLGRLEPDDVAPKVYDSADALLLTSQWETGPICVWEAMARGVAVVSSTYVGSGAEEALVHEQNALLFPVGKPEAAAEQLARLWRDVELRGRLARNARDLVRDRYSVEASVAAWDQAFRSVLASDRLPATDEIVAARAEGRLDRWLGAGPAETLRTWLGKPCPDTGPGGEWPHSYGRTPYEDTEFWSLAKRLDARSESPMKGAQT